jgi:tRNA dimethylallyltransferase
MDIGTAKTLPPTLPQCGRANSARPLPLGGDWGEGLGIDLVNPDEEMNGALFKEYAEKTISEILKRGHLPILVGGTGLWIDLIVDNLALPKVPPDPILRAELERRSEDDLFAEFEKLDPVGAGVIDRHNKRRLVRALEVCKKTARPFSWLRIKGEAKYDALWLGLDWPKEVLDERINRRVDQMIKDGLVEETKGLKEKFGCEVYAMSGIGYREICRHLNGELSLAAAVEQIKKNTRQYAKRQRTWFKQNKNIHWINGLSTAIELVNGWMDEM